MSRKKTFHYILYLLIAANFFFMSAIASFHITLRGETVAAPDIINITLDEAKKELAERKLSIVQTGVQLHESIEQGKIIFQEPSPGSRININKQVKVMLSAGREKVVVPRVIGENFQEINQILKESGLRKGKISHVHTPKYAAGRILAQHPAPLEEVALSSRVSLLVSQGEKEQKYLMPDLIGKQATEAIANLKELDFQVDDIRYTYYPGLESGLIINQFPRPGARIQKRNRITLEVSK